MVSAARRGTYHFTPTPLLFPFKGGGGTLGKITVVSTLTQTVIFPFTQTLPPVRIWEKQMQTSTNVYMSLRGHLHNSIFNKNGKLLMCFGRLYTQQQSVGDLKTKKKYENVFQSESFYHYCLHVIYKNANGKRLCLLDTRVSIQSHIANYRPGSKIQHFSVFLRSPVNGDHFDNVVVYPKNVKE